MTYLAISLQVALERQEAMVYLGRRVEVACRQVGVAAFHRVVGALHHREVGVAAFHRVVGALHHREVGACRLVGVAASHQVVAALHHREVGA